MADKFSWRSFDEKQKRASSRREGARRTKENRFFKADKDKIPFIFKCPLNFLAQSARAFTPSTASKFTNAVVRNQEQFEWTKLILLKNAILQIAEGKSPGW
jgi:hypothetical protein